METTRTAARSSRRWRVAAIAVSVAIVLTAACGNGSRRPAAAPETTVPTTTTIAAPARIEAATPAAVVTSDVADTPVGPVSLAGCPPPVRPSKPGSPPWHPAVLVPDAALPAAEPPPPRQRDTAAVSGKGMWIWKMGATEHGDVAAIAAKARDAGLTQVWVRVGDSQDGFYAASVLEGLVPALHAAGVRVIGWGFPHLYDPVADAAWTTTALQWQSAGGQRLDGFSPDIETSSEGVALGTLRTEVYLGLVRRAAGDRPIIATVYPPTDHWMAVYPYAAIAPYVDAFAPMVYWGCREPGAAAQQAVSRLSPLAPVTPIGQAYNMASEGGREVAPTALEIARFLDASRRAGAIGGSLWDWQEASPEEWASLTAYRWPGPLVRGRSPS